MSPLEDRVAQALFDKDWRGQPRAWRIIAIVLEEKQRAWSEGWNAHVNYKAGKIKRPPNPYRMPSL